MDGCMFIAWLFSLYEIVDEHSEAVER